MVRQGRAESYDDDAPLYTLGSATAGPAEPDDTGHPIAILWLRDPEQRRGWAVHRVERVRPERPPRRMGLR